MSAKSSFLQLVWSQGESMSEAIAAEVRAITRRAAEPIRQALGDTPLWRIRACRLGEAGCFSAAAVFRLQEEYKAFLARHAARQVSAEATERARQEASDRALLQSTLASHLAEVARIQARLSALGEVTPA